MAERTDQELTAELTSIDDTELRQIKDEISETRNQMGETIDELQERLSIPALTAQIKDEVSEQVASAVETTKEILYDTTIKKVSNVMNKISGLTASTGGILPLLLIGAGTGLILMNRNRNSGQSSSRGNGKELGRTGNGQSTRRPDSKNGGASLDAVKDAASGVYHRVEGAISSTASKVSDLAATGKDSYAHYLDSNPMAVGAIAAAMGLAVGLALPLTETESELLGETAGSLRDRLEDAAKKGVDRIKESADEFLEGVGNESAAEMGN